MYDRLQQVLGLVYEDGRYLKYAGPDLEYRFYDLRMELENAPFAPSAPEGITQLNVTGTVTVEVPLSFGFGHLPPMQITMSSTPNMFPGLDFVYFCLAVSHSAKKCLCVLPPGLRYCATDIMRAEEHIDFLI